jgi:hypothetical protein
MTTMDKDGYPDNKELEAIAKWPYTDLPGLMEYIEDLWKFAEYYGWRRRGLTYRISTGGWSGNESLIGAMHQNRMFWAVCWVSSNRGGHHVFRLPKSSRKKS